MSNIVRSLVYGDVLLQFGCAFKTTASAEVEFAERFSGIPTVVFSPYWRDAGHAVGHVETLVRVGGESFDLLSNNGAHDYSVLWIAIGAREGTRAPGASQLVVGDLLMQFGSIHKRSSQQHGVVLPTGYRGSFAPLIAPFWAGSGSGVGHTECILQGNTPWQIGILSGNVAENYFVNWLALGSASGQGSTAFPLQDGVVLEIGIQPKTEPRIEVPLATRFNRPPVVLVTPIFLQGVGHSETLERIDTNAFTVLSGNHAPNHSISWLAIGTAD